MNSEKKVSIVLPTYNGEKYLAQSIQSVLTQTYRNLEFVIVDDCSTDGTPEIIRRFAEEDSRVRVIRNETNQKLPRSLNVGFRQAGGDYLTWTSDDNYYDEDAIETMVSFLEENPPCGMLYCDMNYLCEENAIVLSNRVKPVQALYSGSNFGACFLYRKEAAEAAGEYDPDMFLVEDYDFVLRLSKHYQVCYLPVRKYTYRVHNSSLSATRTKEVLRQLWRLRHRELDYLLANIDEKEKQFLFLDMWLVHKYKTWDLRERFFPGGEMPQRLKWLEKRMTEDAVLEDKMPLVLFGAGEHGQRGVKVLGRERIKCFVDNNLELWGTLVNGIPVISFGQLMEIDTPYQLVFTVGSRFLPEMVAQAEQAGITNYILFLELWMRDEGGV